MTQTAQLSSLGQLITADTSSNIVSVSTGTVNAASHTVGSSFIANTTQVVTTNTVTIGTASYFVANGNFGIGTSSPAYKLDVNGVIRGQSDLYLTKGSSPLIATTDAYDLRLGVNSNEYMRIQYSTGYVGVGTTSPTSTLTVVRGADTWSADFLGLSSSNIVRIGTLSGVSTIGVNNNAGNAWADLSVNPGGNVDLSRDAGLVGIGTNGSLGGKTNIAFNSTVQSGITLIATSGTYNGAMLNFLNASAGSVGYIFSNATSTVFSTASDYRLKENIQPLTGSLERIMALESVTYDWIVDGSRGVGFIAHKLAEQIPHAVLGQKDAIDKNGAIRPQAVDLSRVVPDLVAAVQELTTRIAALEASMIRSEK
ncbi:Intramolecular chaperone auto-processing domain containing protein [uncultured Caudovirales phage]|uniref:Intramolecular chaperone auto-processing domain containing protein n=1 Tax=uncultured Caudovirales phage TaxID=2100421 RepID=A0A6J5NST4_9CAUD|nr:Intramolecular chaperone auto-processing domain containing protein [uncultured Caudovirales phage]